MHAAHDDTYRRFLSMLEDTFPRRVAINLEDAAQFLTQQVGMETSTEMARVYAKSGRLIPGLRKSPAGTWLFPLPALALGLADGFLASPEPPPEPVVFRARAAMRPPVASSRRGRPPRSSLGFVVIDDWLVDDLDKEPRALRWSPHVIDAAVETGKDLTQRERVRSDRSREAWESLAQRVDFIAGQRAAEERRRILEGAPAAVTGIGRHHS